MTKKNRLKKFSELNKQAEISKLANEAQKEIDNKSVDNNDASEETAADKFLHALFNQYIKQIKD